MKTGKEPLMTLAEFEARVSIAFPEAAVERIEKTGELVIYTGWVQADPDNRRRRLRWGKFMDEVTA